MDCFPETVTFRITSRCNNNCKHCFGPEKNKPEMNTIELKNLFEYLKEHGAKAILLTGGEPMLREDFEDIINTLNELGLKIFLDTSGDYFFKHAELITNKVTSLGLPMDFAYKSYRSKENHENVLKILEYYKAKQKRPQIRIMTAVTKENLNELNEIQKTLPQFNIDLWKISQFVIQGNNAIRNMQELSITQEQFKQATKSLLENSNFKILLSSAQDKSKAYFFIQSNGEVFLPTKQGGLTIEKKLGNIYDKDILTKWEKEASKTNYETNIKNTFNIIPKN
jgi:MoaA/NifB/PqqE/SkfB family radical SAM enzyme